MNPAKLFPLFAKLDRELWLTTSRDGTHRGGLIATFVNQASIVPELPRMLIGVARQHHTHELIEASGAFALHLLGEEHLDWVWRFALESGRGRDKLAGLNVVEKATGSPVLADARGWLDCRVEASLDTGDRTVYLAEVLDGELLNPGPILTAQRLLQLAGPDRLKQLRDALTRDSGIDQEAIRNWRRQR